MLWSVWGAQPIKPQCPVDLGLSQSQPIRLQCPVGLGLSAKQTAVFCGFGALSQWNCSVLNTLPIWSVNVVHFLNSVFCAWIHFFGVLSNSVYNFMVTFLSVALVLPLLTSSEFRTLRKNCFMLMSSCQVSLFLKQCHYFAPFLFFSLITDLVVFFLLFLVFCLLPFERRCELLEICYRSGACGCIAILYDSCRPCQGNTA